MSEIKTVFDRVPKKGSHDDTDQDSSTFFRNFERSEFRMGIKFKCP